jgi:hypothetical protein
MSTFVSRTVPRTFCFRSAASLWTTTSSAVLARFSTTGSSCRSTDVAAESRLVG